MPVMMGGEGPWHNFAHACSVAGDNKVFVAGVYTLGGPGATSNAVVMLDLPRTPASKRTQVLPLKIVSRFLSRRSLC